MKGVYEQKKSAKEEVKEFLMGFFIATIGLSFIVYFWYKLMDFIWYLAEITGENKVVVMFHDLLFSISPFLVLGAIGYFLWKLIKMRRWYVFWGILSGIGLIIAFFVVNFVLLILAMAWGGSIREYLMSVKN